MSDRHRFQAFYTSGVPHIDLQDVSVRFGRVPILSDITISLMPGEVVWLRGPNGAGKSTLLRVMAGLIRPVAGIVELFGQPAAPAARRRMGLIAHHPALYEDLTIEENLRFVTDLAAAPSERLDEALEAVGLTGARNRKASEASEGMRRRADLARLLIVEHDVLLLDEAHSGLDREAGGLVEALVERCAARQGVSVIVSHATDIPFANRTLELVEGRL